MEYKNLHPGSDRVAERRRFLLNPNSNFQKLREISDEDLVKLLGHRVFGEKYTSLHPNLDELVLPEDPIRNLIEPTDGAREGDRIRFLQFTDSVYYSPMTPIFRARMYHSRYRGIDTITYSGRELLEARERDLEKYARELMETELFDPARTAIRGITVHGSALRLDENGMMFDARRRYMYDKERGTVVYIKDQMARPLDKPVDIGPPIPEETLKEKSIVYGLETVDYEKADELWELVGHLLEQNVKGGFNPESVSEE
ncbi:MAG: coenzyme-B sulfoethylthiotransferase subunit gamma [Candidatus Syntropharchaeia archaeon]